MKKYVLIGGTFVVAFVLAFVLAWMLFAPAKPPGEPSSVPARTLAAADLGGFLRAVDKGDFAAMKRLGQELFTPGSRLPDSKKLLAEYESSGPPPHQVYAFFTKTGGGKVHRVLLTMDAEDRVVSFLAEEMALAK